MTLLTAFEMVTGECLFEPQAGKYFSRDDGRILSFSLLVFPHSLSLSLDHVGCIIELLGRIPPKIIFSWKQSSKFFSRPGENRSWGVTQKGIGADSVGHEAAPFTSFLLPMLEYIPAKRTTAVKCLQHPWLSTQCPDQPCDSFSGDGTQNINLFHTT
uniref:non-specific serine/threonine protein kinase n=1 Tax=Chelonoidis abingdonii TaxID=106734 RepID=A0A8C0JCM0_CHEAB